MAIEIKMPALSPTMEEGTLAKWLIKEGDTVKSGDIMAEIETDKATMEFEAVDEGTIGKILVAEGTDGVKVGTVIATLNAEGEEAAAPVAPAAAKESPEEVAAETPPSQKDEATPTPHLVQTGARQMFEAAKHDAEIKDPAIPAGTEMVKVTLREALRDAMAEEISTAPGASPSSSSTAIGALTLTPSLPSGTRILPILPSSTASNSIVALSVSISARMSPDLTVSPSFTCHLASLPSSMVGDRAGIRICVVISEPQAASISPRYLPSSCRQRKSHQLS